MTTSNPTTSGLHYDETVLRALAAPEVLRYAPEALGLDTARQAVAELAGCLIEQVAMTASTSESYSWLFKLLCDAGDNVLAPKPSYPLFEYLAALENVDVRQYPLQYGEGWFVDFSQLEGLIGERTRAVIAVHPNNPTGSYHKPAEAERLLNLCERHGLALISDEVFAPYAMNGEHLSLGGNDRALTFVLDGLSKRAGLPQMKAGWILASGPGSEEAMQRLELIADTYLSIGTPVQHALPALLQAGAEVRRQIQARCAANLAALPEALRVEGGWTAIVRCPSGRSDEEWTTQLLEEQGVLVQPGYFYDFPSGEFVVLSLLTPIEEFNHGIVRLRRTNG